MVLTKTELLDSLGHEVRVVLHLLSKVEPAQLDYRPTPNQRSLLQLAQYLTIMGPIHLRTVASGAFEMDRWRADWQSGQTEAKEMDLEQVKSSIAQQPALYSELLAPLGDAELRMEMEMFGSRASRGLWLSRLVLSHFAAYRMQLFLYLKASGREDLSTLNLWAGVDAR